MTASSAGVAIVHASIHDALNALDHRYEAYQARISAAPGASAEVAVAAAAHASLGFAYLSVTFLEGPRDPFVENARAAIMPARRAQRQ